MKHRKFLTKLITITLATITACTVFAGAGCNNEGAKIDTSKSQLRVYSFTGGVGRKFLDDAITRFQDDYANYEFEPGSGKKGVQIIPSAVKSTEINTLASSGNHVLFAEAANYDALVTGDDVLDVTDIVTKPLNEVLGNDVCSETATIESKLYPESKDYLTFKDGRYYGLPHYSYYSTLIYNKQLFDDEKLYFRDNPGEITAIEDNFIFNSSDVKSCGPDGKMNTTDDGLPATWDEFWILCDYMKETITPFTFTNTNAGESIEYLLNAVYLNLAGKDEAKLNYTYDSNGETITIIERFDGQGNPVTKEEVVNNENYGVVLNSSLAKYQAIEVANKVINAKNYRSTDSTTGLNMLRVQQNYIESRHYGDKPTAFLIEGSYWYNEADDANYFEDARNAYNGFDSKNEFLPMPLPRIYNGTAEDIKEKVITKSVVNDQPDAYGVINAKFAADANLMNLAKMFFAYCYTQESLEQFTILSRCPKNLNYEIDEEKLSGYALANWKHYKNSDLVNPYSSSDIYLNKKRQFSLHLSNSFWRGKTYTSVYSSLRNNNRTPQSYFEDVMIKMA